MDDLDISDCSIEEININERDLRHELCGLKLWNPEGSSLQRFPWKLNKLVPHWIVQERAVDSEFFMIAQNQPTLHTFDTFSTVRVY